MENSKLGAQKWVMAIYLLVTSIKGISSRKLAKDLGITQKTAWHMTHRIREAFNTSDTGLLGGVIEVDEIYEVKKKQAREQETNT